jgi:hypothetical protein
MTRRPLDYYVLGGVASFGWLDSDTPFRTPDMPRMFDKRQGYGLSGAHLFYRGLDLSNFSAIHHVVTRDIDRFCRTDPDYLAFHAMLMELPTSNLAFPSKDIVHPILADVGVRSVVIVNHLAWAQTGDGRWTKEVRYSTNNPLKQALNKAFGATTRPVAKTEDEKRLQQLGDKLAAQKMAYEALGRRPVPTTP